MEDSSCEECAQDIPVHHLLSLALLQLILTSYLSPSLFYNGLFDFCVSLEIPLGLVMKTYMLEAGALAQQICQSLPHYRNALFESPNCLASHPTAC